MRWAEKALQGNYFIKYLAGKWKQISGIWWPSPSTSHLRHVVAGTKITTHRSPAVCAAVAEGNWMKISAFLAAQEDCHVIQYVSDTTMCSFQAKINKIHDSIALLVIQWGILRQGKQRQNAGTLYLGRIIPKIRNRFGSVIIDVVRFPFPNFYFTRSYFNKANSSAEFHMNVISRIRSCIRFAFSLSRHFG